MKILTVFIFLMTLNSCVHKPFALLTEAMLPDGRTWEVKTQVNCADIKDSASKCKERFGDVVRKHGTELCGATPQRVFACALRGNPDYTTQGSCYVECTAGN